MIAGAECDAMLGSMKALSMGKDVFYIPIIVMEWIFINPKIIDLCGYPKIQAMTQVLHESGYVPFSADRSTKLDHENSVNWPEMMIMEWIHKESVFYKDIKLK